MLREQEVLLPSLHVAEGTHDGDDGQEVESVTESGVDVCLEARQCVCTHKDRRSESYDDEDEHGVLQD